MTARFQSFDDTADRAASGPRVATLRAELARRGLDGFIVPRADRFQNEYVPPSDERLSWLTGFLRSAGTPLSLAGAAGPVAPSGGRPRVVGGRPPACAGARAGGPQPVRDRAGYRDAALSV